MEEFFKRMDRDFDGRLSFEEFMGKLRTKGEVGLKLLPGEETTLEKLFKNMDKNNDGVVSKQVLCSISSNLPPNQSQLPELLARIVL